MASLEAHRLRKLASRLPTAFVPKLMAPMGRGGILQWTIVGTVAIVLGIFTIGVTSLPPQWASLFVLAVLCPFIVMIVGSVRRLLLAVILYQEV